MRGPASALAFAAVLACSSRAVPQSRAPEERWRTLPLTEVPARPGHVLAVFMTGDGGWVELPREIAKVLSDSGIAVVGLDSRAYLSRERTPDELARDLDGVIDHYARLWNRDRLVLVGYSRGAEFLPFVANRLSAPHRAALELGAMLAPAEKASFVFHWADMLRNTSRPEDIPLAPEVLRMGGSPPLLCVYGRDEEESLCRTPLASRMLVVERPGKHHFDRNYRFLGELIARTASTVRVGSNR